MFCVTFNGNVVLRLVIFNIFNFNRKKEMYWDKFGHVGWNDL